MNEKRGRTSSSCAFADAKRGQGLPISTIILLIIGIVILVFLIIGFTQGWGKFSTFFSKNNVQEVATNCDIACTTNSEYDYCTAKRNLNADDEKLSQVTCNFLSLYRTNYGIAECPSIQCRDFVFSSSSDMNLLTGACNDPLNLGKEIIYLEKGVLKVFACKYPACPVKGGDAVAIQWCSALKLDRAKHTVGDKVDLCLPAGSTSPVNYVCTAEDIPATL